MSHEMRRSDTPRLPIDLESTRILFEDMVSKWKEDGSFSLMVYGGCAVIFAGASFVTIRMLRYIGDSDSSIRARRKMLRDRRIRKNREKSRSIEARRRRRTSRKSRWKASQSENTETKMPKIADEIAATLESISKKKVEMVSIGTQTLDVHDEDICSNDVLIGSRIASKLPEDLTLTKLFKGMGMGAYVRVFQSHDIDIDALMLLEQPQLKELGLAIGPRVKLMDIIRLLRHGKSRAVFDKISEWAEASKDKNRRHLNQSHDLDEESEGQPDTSLLGIHDVSEEHVSHTMGRFSPQGQEPEFGMSPSYSYQTNTNGHQNTHDHHDGSHVMMFYATRPDSAQSHSNVQSIEEVYDDDIVDSKRSYVEGSAEDSFVASSSSPRRHRRDADFSKYLKQARRSIGRHMST